MVVCPSILCQSLIIPSNKVYEISIKSQNTFIITTKKIVDQKWMIVDVGWKEWYALVFK